MQKSRKEQIILISANLFKDRGYSAVTMRDIAAEMDIKASSLYNHIKSKQDILAEVIISLAEKFTNSMESIIRLDIGSIEKLKKIIALHIEVTSNNMPQMASLNNDWMHLEEHLEYYLKLRSNYENNFRAIIIHGINAKEVAPGNVEVMVFSILSTLRSLYLWMPKKEDLTATDLTIQLSEILIEGIRAN